MEYLKQLNSAIIKGVPIVIVKTPDADAFVAAVVADQTERCKTSERNAPLLLRWDIGRGINAVNHRRNSYCRECAIKKVKEYRKNKSEI